MVCILIDSDTRHHSGQNSVDSRDVAEWVCNKSTDLAKPLVFDVK